MPPHLTSPVTGEPTSERGDGFPYSGDDTGFPLPTATARNVLRSRDAAGAIGVTGSTTCPACGGETVNGAGLFTCTECSWDGALR